MTESGDNTIYSEFNYDTLRAKNLQQVKVYYNQVMNTYQSDYNQYKTNMASTVQANKDKAQYMATEGTLPKMNRHLIDIINQLNSTIQQDITNLKIQQDKVKQDDSIIANNKRLISDLNEAMLMKNTDISKNTSSYKETREANRNYSEWEMLYIFVIFVLFFLVLWLLYKAVFGGNSTSANNSNNARNARNSNK
jgi:hypothetical protein